jgi:hypothetical protein
MTSEEETYEIAVQRIRIAKDTGAADLDLGGWNTNLFALERLPPEVASLTLLQLLTPRRVQATQPRPSPLATLISLQSLDLDECRPTGGRSSKVGSMGLKAHDRPLIS